MDDANTQENIKEPKKLLGHSVEESRVKRVEKQNARYRDRGGYVNHSILEMEATLINANFKNLLGYSSPQTQIRCSICYLLAE